MTGNRAYAILYLRPDGWWIPADGEGFVTREAAEAEADKHPWEGTPWKVVREGSVQHTSAVNFGDPSR